MSSTLFKATIGEHSVIPKPLIIVIPKFKLVQKLTDELNGVTRENINGIRVIRAFNAEDYQEDKFNKVNDELFYHILTRKSDFFY